METLELWAQATLFINPRKQAILLKMLNIYLPEWFIPVLNQKNILVHTLSHSVQNHSLKLLGHLNRRAQARIVSKTFAW